MSLRTRLTLTILAVAIPLAGGMVWLRGDLRRRSLERGLREFVRAAMQSGGRRHCEANPHGFPPPTGFPGGPPPPPHDRPPPPPPPLPEHRVVMWAYDADLRPSNRDAPALPPRLRNALLDGAPMASELIDVDGHEKLRLALRMPWREGPCSVVFAEQIVPEHLEEDDTIVWGLVLLCGGLLFAVLLAVGPIVQRIRRLQSDVRKAAASRYATEVDVEGKDEIADLAVSFNEAGRDVRRHLADVEAREATLRRFVADTTHDVMIPLTVLQGYLSDIRRQAERGEAPAAAILRRTLEEAHYLGSLLHNLGVVAKLEAEEEAGAFEPVDLSALVERVVERHRPVARAREIELEYAVPDGALNVLGDVTLIEQAVSNVVHNAVRYNHDGGHVSVVLEAQDGRFRLRVLDDGPGVSEAQLARLTERRFRSTPARTRVPGGLGLGLHIARHVADRHGFELSFRRLEERGLEVVFEGPRVTGGPS